MCLGCQKCILYHHKIMSCHDYKTIYHGICSKTILKFSHSTGKWICLQCLSNKKPVYNPFDNIGYDKHDPFNMVECDDINQWRNVACWRPSTPTAPPFLAPLPHLKSKAKLNKLSYFRKYATKIYKNVCF